MWRYDTISTFKAAYINKCPGCLASIWVWPKQRAPGDRKEKNEVRVFIPWFSLCRVTSCSLKASLSKWPSWHDSRFLVTPPSHATWMEGKTLPPVAYPAHMFANGSFIKHSLDYLNPSVTCFLLRFCLIQQGFNKILVNEWMKLPSNDSKRALFWRWQKKTRE